MPKITTSIETTMHLPDGTTKEHAALIEKHWRQAFPGMVQASEGPANADHTTQCAATGHTPVRFKITAHITAIRHH
jgi:hypothetical protein